MRVLIVEPEKETRADLSLIAHGAGFETSCAQSSSEALPLIPESDILVLDFGANGTAEAVFLSWLDQPERRPVLVVDDSMTHDGAKEFLVRGASHAMSKPISEAVYLSLLQRYRHQLDMFRTLSELRKSNRQLSILATTAVSLAVISVGEPALHLFKNLLELLF